MSVYRGVGIGVMAIVLLGAAGVVGTNSVASASPASGSYGAGTFVAVTSTRIMDSSRPLGARAPAPHGVTRLPVLGGVVPSSAQVTAVVVTVTVSAPAASGYLTVYQDGGTLPGTSNVNFAAGRSQADQVYAPVGTNGDIDLYNGSAGAMRVLVDVTGYFARAAAAPAGSFVALTPRRVLDTRSGSGGGALPGHSTRAVQVTGVGSTPPGGAAVAFTLTALSPSAGGYLSVFAAGGSRPGTSNLDFAAHQAVGNLVVTSVGTGGKINVYNGSAGSVQLVVDEQGYFVSGTPRLGGTYVPITPTRVFSEQSVPAQDTFGYDNDVAPYLSSDDVAASEVVNLTASGVGASGFAVAYPTNKPRPPAVSTMSLTRGFVTAGLTQAPGGTIYNGTAASVRFTGDLFGYYVAPAGLGAITGHVTDASTHSGIGQIGVTLLVLRQVDLDQSVSTYAQVTTAADGSYSFPSANAGDTVYLCVDTLHAVQPNASTGYRSQCYGATANDPTNETPVTLTAGSTTTIDIALPQIAVGTVAGHTTNAAGARLGGLGVTFTRHGATTAEGQLVTDGSGAYYAELASGSYDVCFAPNDIPKGGTLYGYAPVCRTVTVTTGATVSGDQVIPAYGGISGRVTTSAGQAVTSGGVEAFLPNGGPAGSAELSSTGTFTIPTLAPGSYRVCVVTNPASLPPYGYADQCFQNVPWPEGLWGDIPSGTTPVVVASGTIKSIGTMVLAQDGAISGQVADSHGKPIPQGVSVEVYDPANGAVAGQSQVDAQGSYTVIGLAASSTGYSVCFIAQRAGLSPVGQCYKGVTWNTAPPVPSGTTPVSVTSGIVHTSVNATLPI